MSLPTRVDLPPAELAGCLPAAGGFLELGGDVIHAVMVMTAHRLSKLSAAYETL
jgi:hypothetical protein